MLAIPVAVLVGLAFAAPIAAWAAHTENEASFVAIFRFVILPMFLFSGTFFPSGSLPQPLEALAYVTPLWHGVDLWRQLTLGDVDPTSALLHVDLPRRLRDGRHRRAPTSRTAGGSSK